ncbi:MAG TPA: cell envelope integrity protein CreD [Croceibacterium sp.]|nr:cell envelope integrity protein CreD [Croceibacterium sp.]
MSSRSPGIRLLVVGLVAAVLTVPLLMVYMLVRDRESQSQAAQAAITAGWGGPQVVSGPVLAIPYLRDETITEGAGNQAVTRTRQVRAELYLSPAAQTVRTAIEPEKRSYSIYSSVIYRARLDGTARFRLPDELAVDGVRRDRLLLDEAELRFGVSDPRGLQQDARVTAGRAPVALQPGKGVASSGNSGFYGKLAWDGAPIEVAWSYDLRGSHGIALVPRGGETRWEVTSPWPHPSFGGEFLPDKREVGDSGFSATFGVTNLALGQALAVTADPGPPQLFQPGDGYPMAPAMTDRTAASVGGPSMAASIALTDPVDLYSRVDRSVKYGFLFIGFTFLALLMFDVVGGARVATAEYLLTGAGLVLFFVLLLAFAEVIGFTWAYLLASAAIIALLTAYSAAVLQSRRRAGFIGALLVSLYATIYVLLSLEAYSLVVGSVLLFAALAGVMYATRNVDWSNVGQTGEAQD